VAVTRCHPPATLPADLGELRLLAELPAVRRLADRGLSDEEHALARKLADATLRAARDGDVPGYVRADMAFHLGLLGLTADRALSQMAQVLLTAAPKAELPGYLMTLEAREHRELAGLLADGMMSAADHLLRLHISRRASSRNTPSRLAETGPAGTGA
jgi:DNA-binding GntR family transcriptional regulator